ncbi:MAG: hypothetical protein HY720_03290 [Planctomycetes bacterium]|nr:hypothetical protein [Planctomycetota bacterium]
MTESLEGPRDPLIDEVRERRRELIAHLGGDLERVFKALQERQAEEPNRLIDLRERRRQRVR